jgi:hypothetical protein
VNYPAWIILFSETGVKFNVAEMRDFGLFVICIEASLVTI